MDSLFQLIYVSTAVRPFSDGELEGLLANARSFNSATAITGFLVYVKGGFLQVLEGRRGDVLEVFERIQKDPRHEQIVCLVQKRIPERYFPAWSMGFDYVSRKDAPELPGYQSLRKLSIPDLESTAHQLIDRFIKQMA